MTQVDHIAHDTLWFNGGLVFIVAHAKKGRGGISKQPNARLYHSHADATEPLLIAAGRLRTMITDAHAGFQLQACADIQVRIDDQKLVDAAGARVPSC